METKSDSESEEKLENKYTFKPEIKNTRAYHLSDSDNLVTPLVATLLNGENYHVCKNDQNNFVCKDKTRFHLWNHQEIINSI